MDALTLLEFGGDESSGGGGGGSTHTGEHGRARIDGLFFKRDDGSIYPWRHASDFSLLQRFVKGEDVRPILADRVSAGALGARVFYMFNGEGIGSASGLGAFWPEDYTDAQVDAFLELLAEYGLRQEGTCLADAQDRSFAWMQGHLNRCATIFSRHWNANFAEMCNEPGKNLPNGLADVRRFTQPNDPGVLWTSGDYDIAVGATSHPVRDYFVGHGERKDEWPRTCRALGEWRDGFGWADGSSFPGVKIPCVDDEPMGCADVNQPGKRSNVASDFSQAAAGYQLFGAGGTFHSDDGVASRVWSQTQRACAVAFFSSMAWVPPDCQLAPYQRGSAGNGPGVGDMPIVHHDLDEGVEPAALRSFCKRATGFEWCLRIRPVGPTETRRGCSVEAEPSSGLVQVKEP